MGAADGQKVVLPKGTSIIKLGGDDTRGTFALIADETEPNQTIPLHVHKKHSETFYVVEGELEIQVGDNVIRATPGTTVHVPPGVPHGVHTRTARAHMVVIMAPADLANMLVEMGRLSVEQAKDPKFVSALMARYDTEAVAPK